MYLAHLCTAQVQIHRTCEVEDVKMCTYTYSRVRCDILVRMLLITNDITWSPRISLHRRISGSTFKVPHADRQSIGSRWW